MTDDLLQPEVPAEGEKVRDEERRDDVADRRAEEALEREDEVPGIEGAEHLGLTPPD